MDEEDHIPENCIILSPEELARLGVKLDTLATAADQQSSTENGKHLTTAIEDKPQKPKFNDRIKRLVQVLCHTALNNTPVTQVTPNVISSDIKTHALPLENLRHLTTHEELADTRMTAFHKPSQATTPLFNLKSTSDPNIIDEKTEIKSSMPQFECRPQLLQISGHDTGRPIQSEIADHVAPLQELLVNSPLAHSKKYLPSDSKIKRDCSPEMLAKVEAPQVLGSDCNELVKAPKKTINVLSNRKVHIPTQKLKQILPTLSTVAILPSVTPQDNIKGQDVNKKEMQIHDTDTISSDPKVDACRPNLARILQTDKLFKKFENQDAHEVTNEILNTTNSYQPLTPKINVRPVIPDAHQVPNNDPHSESLNSKFHLTLNSEGLLVDIKEVKPKEFVIGSETGSLEQKTVSKEKAKHELTVDEGKIKMVRHNLNRLLQTRNLSYKSKNVETPTELMEDKLNQKPKIYASTSVSGLPSEKKNKSDSECDDIFEEYLAKHSNTAEDETSNQISYQALENSENGDNIFEDHLANTNMFYDNPSTDEENLSDIISDNSSTDQEGSSENTYNIRSDSSSTDEEVSSKNTFKNSVSHSDKVNDTNKNTAKETNKHMLTYSNTVKICDGDILNSCIVPDVQNCDTSSIDCKASSKDVNISFELGEEIIKPLLPETPFPIVKKYMIVTRKPLSQDVDSTGGRRLLSLKRKCKTFAGKKIACLSDEECTVYRKKGSNSSKNYWIPSKNSDKSARENNEKNENNKNVGTLIYDWTENPTIAVVGEAANSNVVKPERPKKTTKEESKITRKRGRPRKSSTERAIKTTTDPLIKGTTRNEFNYSLFQTDSLSGDGSATDYKAIKNSDDNSIPSKMNASTREDNQTNVETVKCNLTGNTALSLVGELKTTSDHLSKESETVANEQSKIPKKRGRPRKSSIERAVKTITEPQADTNVFMGTSKKGRKRNEINYSLFETDGLSDEGSTTDYKEINKSDNNYISSDITDVSTREDNQITVETLRCNLTGNTALSVGGELKNTTEHTTKESEAVANEQSKIPKKRGRPRKSSIERAVKTITEPQADTNVFMGTSKKGRKRNEFNYSLFETDGLSDEGGTTDYKELNKSDNNYISSDITDVSTREDNQITVETLRCNLTGNTALSVGGELKNTSEDTTKETEAVANEQSKIPKKRGRPRKSSIERAVKTITEPQADTNVFMGTSKKGRKRNEFNYSLFETDGLSDEGSTTDYKELNKSDNNYNFSDITDVSTREDNQITVETLRCNLTGNTALSVGGELKNTSEHTTKESQAVAKEQSKIPKKRGRPRKSSIERAAKTITESQADSNVFIGTSKKGRKRNDSNYSLFKTDDMSDEGSTTDYKEINRSYNNYISSDITEASTREDNQIHAGTLGFNWTGNTAISAVGDSENISIHMPEERKTMANEQSTISIKRERPRKTINVCIQKDNIIGNPNNDESSKYNWTGNTTMAMNQIFSFIQGKDATEISHDSQSGLMKRKKKRDAMSFVENGTSECLVCNETIVNLEWPIHKRNMHYNLAWRTGEPPLDMSDALLILKILKELRKEQGYLKCNKCGKEIGQPRLFLDHLEVCNGVVTANGSVTCAVCKKEMSKNEWQYHKYKEHNNLAWRQGDAPLDLNDQDLVVRILTQLYKAKKPLHCELCKQQKKSVLGYLSHKSVCQMSAMDVENVKVACTICGKKTLPVSMQMHMKTHNKTSFGALLEDSGYFNVDLDVGGPRKAAKQALQVIKSVKGECVSGSKYYAEQCDFQDDFVVNELKKRAAECPSLPCLFDSCSFIGSSVDILIQHLSFCDKKPDQYYVCKLCLMWCNAEAEMNEHIKAKHNRVIDKDDEFGNEAEQGNSEEDCYMEEVELEKKRLRNRKKAILTNNVNHRVKPIFLVHPIREQIAQLVYPHAYPWMYDFCEKHYSNLRLFENVRNSESWRVLDYDILDEYLPRHHESCDFTVMTLNANKHLADIDKLRLRKMELFEITSFYEGEATIYCGGPITALAWLPTPYNQENTIQILAVAVVKEADREYSVGKIYSEPHVIQFWGFEGMEWRQDHNFEPFLLYGLALNTGPVWHMEWCPSGCFDTFKSQNASRLGLLAVATSDSFVYIYSIENKDESDRGLIYKGEPKVKLQLEAEKGPNEEAYYATRVSWTKAREHRYIAVGYSTGMIALFDLMSTDGLMRRHNTAGPQIILPYLTFQGHVSCITALTLGHYSGGNRWCFSAGLDKSLVFWDLSKLTKITFHRKYGVTDGLWLTQWPACLVAEDESTFNEMAFAHTFIKPLRDVMAPEFYSFTFSPSGIKSVSFSDWLNLIMHGGNAGEITGQFAHRMFFNIDKKHFKKGYTKCIFSVAKIIDKNHAEDSAQKSYIYEEATNRYGLAFIDYNSADFLKIPNSRTNTVKIKEVEKYSVHEYPLRAINKVAANPNLQACTFYASGYQAGFLRVRGMAFLKTLFEPFTLTGYNFSENL